MADSVQRQRWFVCCLLRHCAEYCLCYRVLPDDGLNRKTSFPRADNSGRRVDHGSTVFKQRGLLMVKDDTLPVRVYHRH